MKKRLSRSLFLSVMTISLVTHLTAPMSCHDDSIKVKNNISLQLKKTNINKISIDNIKEQKENNELISKFVKYNHGYTTARVNMRASPDLNSEVIDVLEFNTYLEYTPYNEEWVCIKYDKQANSTYVYKKYISNKKIESMEYSVPNNNGFKSYMPYNSITLTSSKQYKLQNYYAYTGEYGIRQANGRYCVAIGTAFNADIGDYGDLILENEEIIPIVISDIKADKDTDCNNIITMHNGCVSEFIVDTSVLPTNILKHGDISIAKEKWDSKVVSIKIYNKNIFN